MKTWLLLLAVIAAFSFQCVIDAQPYKPTWESLDARPLPGWYDDVKFGIFVHWGVFSVPSYTCGGVAAEWYWFGLETMPCFQEFHYKTYGKDFKYQDFVTSFSAALFNATQWADLFHRSGAKYVVLTSKHHEGYTNWRSNQSWNWNSVDSKPHQDNVALLSKAVKAIPDMHMGLYHSLFEWFNPLYLNDASSKYNTTVYVDTILHPQLHDIINTYKPDVLWSDGDWMAPDTYWKSKEFLAWLYNSSPVRNTIVTNDRWGQDDTCKHGGFWTCSDRYNPGKLLTHKWENALTIDTRTWGYARNSDIADFMSIEDLLFQLASTVSCNGNMLLNVGPTSEGTITPIYQERLLQLGAFLKVNGEAIYNTTYWRVQNDTADQTVWYTKSKIAPVIYAIVLAWPDNSAHVLTLTQPKVHNTNARFLLVGGVSGHNLPYKANPSGNGVALTFPDRATLPADIINQHAWVVAMYNIN